jgi:hypothetical protein
MNQLKIGANEKVKRKKTEGAKTIPYLWEGTLFLFTQTKSYALQYRKS